MEPKYQQAIRTGLYCGIVLAVIYLIFSAVTLYVSSTPAMKSYTEKISEPFKNVWKDWPNVQPQPVTFPTDVRPPFEYYVSAMISIAMWGVVLLGLLLTGAYALQKGGLAKYTTQDALYVGALSGAAAFVPLLVAMLIVSVVSVVWSSEVTAMTAFMPPGFAAALPFFSVLGTCCCCLPVGIVISFIASAIGALGYGLLSNRI